MNVSPKFPPRDEAICGIYGNKDQQTGEMLVKTAGRHTEIRRIRKKIQSPQAKRSPDGQRSQKKRLLASQLLRKNKAKQRQSAFNFTRHRSKQHRLSERYWCRIATSPVAIAHQYSQRRPLSWGSFTFWQPRVSRLMGKLVSVKWNHFHEQSYS